MVLPLGGMAREERQAPPAMLSATQRDLCLLARQGRGAAWAYPTALTRWAMNRGRVQNQTLGHSQAPLTAPQTTRMCRTHFCRYLRH